MLISQRKVVKHIDEMMVDLHRMLNANKINQNIMRIVTFVLGGISGMLVTVLTIKYMQYEDLLLETTRPMPLPLSSVVSHQPTAVQPFNLTEEVRVLCWVLTHPFNHLTKAKAVKATWGRRCNKLVFISTQSEDFLGDMLLVNVTEERRYLWGKTKQGLKQVYQNYGNDYDWFLKADDDTWMFMENLRYFLYSYSPEMPIYFGCKLKPYVAQGYMSGSGYVLSREAVRRFNEEALVDDYKCWNGTEGNEDVEVGKCLAAVGVLAGDSRDIQHRWRFMPFPPDGLMRNLFGESWLDNATFYELKKGPECCSTSAISFHYITFNEMYVYDYLLYFFKLETQPQTLPRKLTFDEVKRHLNVTQTNNPKR